MALKQLTIKKKITVRSSNSIEKYLQQVKNRSKLLTADQEVELTQTIQKGLALEKEVAKKRKELHHIIRVSHKSQDPTKLKQAQRAQKNFKKYSNLIDFPTIILSIVSRPNHDQANSGFYFPAYEECVFQATTLPPVTCAS